MAESPKGYVVNDRRGKDAPSFPCRVCGSAIEHSTDYNRPTMDCIRFLQEKLQEKIARIEEMMERDFETK